MPGYGLAVAQAQHDVRSLGELLEEQRRRRPLRDPPGRRTDAGPHERAARGGERAVRRALRDGRDQPRVPADRRRRRGRRERRRQPGGAELAGSPIYGMPILDVDKAHSVVVHQALARDRVRGRRQPALLRSEDGDALRRREDRARTARRCRQGGLSASRRPVLRRRRRRGGRLAGARARGGARRVRRVRARRVDDAAEGLRARVPGGRLPRDAGARRRPCAAQVGDVVSGEPRARAADGDRARARLRRLERGAAGGARRRRGDGAPDRRGGGARRGDARAQPTPRAPR